MAQYPKTVAILLPGGATAEGRTDVRALFQGFCQPFGVEDQRDSFPAIKSWTLQAVNVSGCQRPLPPAPYYGAELT